MSVSCKLCSHIDDSLRTGWGGRGDKYNKIPFILPKNNTYVRGVGLYLGGPLCERMW